MKRFLTEYYWLVVAAFRYVWKIDRPWKHAPDWVVEDWAYCQNTSKDEVNDAIYAATREWNLRKGGLRETS